MDWREAVVDGPQDWEVLIVDGYKFSRELFRVLAEGPLPSRWLRVIARDDKITFECIDGDPRS